MVGKNDSASKETLFTSGCVILATSKKLGKTKTMLDVPMNSFGFTL
jgi:hypothetical protein